MRPPLRRPTLAGRPRPRLAWAVITVGLLACGAIAVIAAHPIRWELAGLLLALAVISTLCSVDIGPMLVSGSVGMDLLACALLGGSAAFVIALGSQLLVWPIERLRPTAVAVNTLTWGGPLLLTGIVLDAATTGLKPVDWRYAVALVVAGLFLWTINLASVAFLVGLRDGDPLMKRMAPPRYLFAGFAMSAVQTLLIYELYRRMGLAAIGLAFAVPLSFRYTGQLVIQARRRADRIAELAASRAELVNQALAADDRARRALAEELHDEAIQTLIVARQDLEEARHGDAARVDRAERAINGVVDQLRDAVFELHPAVLEHAGLAAALKAVAKREAQRAGHALNVRVEVDAGRADERLLFSVGRELLRNAIRHADAMSITIAITQDHAGVSLEVIDDGRGFDQRRREEALTTGHIGLASSAQRVEAVGGRLVVDTAPGRGTRVLVTIPIAP